MNKILKGRTKLATIAVTGVLSLVASIVPMATAAQAKTLTIGVLIPEENQNAYSASYSKNIHKKAVSLGVKLIVLNSNYTASIQQAQMKQLIAKKVDGIILWPAQFGTTKTMLLAAKKAKIPVILSNSTIAAAERSLYVAFTGPSDIRIGNNQADAVNKLLGGKGGVVIVTGQPGNTAAIGRLEGFKSQIAKVAPGITILGTQPGNWLQAMSQTATANLLTTYGSKVNAVVTADDVEAAGAAAAIESAGLTGKVSLVGAGYYEVTPPLVQSGAEAATVFQSPCWDAIHALAAMNNVLKGKTVKDELMPVPVVNKANASQFTPMGCLAGDTL